MRCGRACWRRPALNITFGTPDGRGDVEQSADMVELHRRAHGGRGDGWQSRDSNSALHDRQVQANSPG